MNDDPAMHLKHKREILALNAIHFTRYHQIPDVEKGHLEINGNNLTTYPFAIKSLTSKACTLNANYLSSQD
jgi:hypothetical protein